MIVIFSNVEDISTFDVMKWLHHLGVRDVLRVNTENTDASIYVSEGDFYVRLDGRTIRLKDISAVWYRKGRQWLCRQFRGITFNEHPALAECLNVKVKREEAKLSEYLHHMIEHSVPVLGSAFKSDLNKLIVLSLAKSVGLLVPDFYVGNSKEYFTELLDKPDGFITKSMSDGVYLFENKELETAYFTYTEKVSPAMIDDLPEKTAVSFLQRNIDKAFELRIFFLDGKCYAMAIFSQLDKKTKVDFRKYNEAKPNRTVPFVLPEAIDKKIIQLFEKLDMRTGSVDMIVDKKNRYYFLEINPVGQFGMVSVPCNYYLEKKVALTLIEDAKRTA